MFSTYAFRCMYMENNISIPSVSFFKNESGASPEKKNVILMNNTFLRPHSFHNKIYFYNISWTKLLKMKIIFA